MRKERDESVERVVYVCVTLSSGNTPFRSLMLCKTNIGKNNFFDVYRCAYKQYTRMFSIHVRNRTEIAKNMNLYLGRRVHFMLTLVSLSDQYICYLGKILVHF